MESALISRELGRWGPERLVGHGTRCGRGNTGGKQGSKVSGFQGFKEIDLFTRAFGNLVARSELVSVRSLRVAESKSPP